MIFQAVQIRRVGADDDGLAGHVDAHRQRAGREHDLQQSHTEQHLDRRTEFVVQSAVMEAQPLLERPQQRLSVVSARELQPILDQRDVLQVHEADGLQEARRLLQEVYRVGVRLSVAASVQTVARLGLVQFFALFLFLFL